MRQKRRPVYEAIIIGGVIVLAIIMGAALTKARAKVEKDNLLVDELSTIRAAIVTHKIRNDAFPASLEDLTSQTMDVENGGKRPYLERLPMAAEGKWVDPFGNPYAYDPVSGWVRSSSPGHERW